MPNFVSALDMMKMYCLHVLCYIFNERSNQRPLAALHPRPVTFVVIVMIAMLLCLGNVVIQIRFNASLRCSLDLGFHSICSGNIVTPRGDKWVCLQIYARTNPCNRVELLIINHKAASPFYFGIVCDLSNF